MLSTSRMDWSICSLSFTLKVLSQALKELYIQNQERFVFFFFSKNAAGEVHAKHCLCLTLVILSGIMNRIYLYMPNSSTDLTYGGFSESRNGNIWVSLHICGHRYLPKTDHYCWRQPTRKIMEAFSPKNQWKNKVLLILQMAVSTLNFPFYMLQWQHTGFMENIAKQSLFLIKPSVTYMWLFC